MGDIYISPNCEYCRDLLLGIQKYDFLSDKFNIINVEFSQFPEYIHTVPALVKDGQLLIGENIFKYFSDIVDSYLNQNDGNIVKRDQIGLEEPKKQESDIVNGDEFQPWCSNGNCLEYSMITENNDNFTDGMHAFNSNISYIDGDELSDNIEKCATRVPLSKDDSFNKSDKLKQFDSDYEQMMSIRNNIK